MFLPRFSASLGCFRQTGVRPNTTLHLGLSENVGYIPNYSHLIGIMISKTIGFRGLAYFQTHPYQKQLQLTCGAVVEVHLRRQHAHDDHELIAAR